MIEMPRFSDLEIHEIAQKAGSVIMKVYNGAFESSIRHKADRTPVTLADLSAHESILNSLNKLNPTLPVISEEGIIPDYSIRKSYKRYWLVDPLDGTKEFIKRNGDFTVNIALIDDGKPIFGCVYAPASRDLFWARTGKGAFLKRKGKVYKLKVNDFSLEEEGLRFACSRSYLSKATQKYISGFKNTELVQRGSSIKMMMLAEGVADIYPRLGTTMEWDIAASQVILEEAGGSILKFSDKTPMEYNKKDLRNPEFIAYGNVK